MKNFTYLTKKNIFYASLALHLLVLVSTITIALLSVSLNVLVLRIKGDCSNCDLSGAVLSGKNLNDKKMSNVNLSDANLSDANLANTDLESSNLTNVNLERANLQGAILLNSNLSNANLNYTNLTTANLNQAQLKNTNLEQANLVGANLSHATLTNTNLSSADLTDVNLSYAQFNSSTNFQGANLSNIKVTKRFSNDPPKMDDKTIYIDGNPYVSATDLANTVCQGNPVKSAQVYAQESKNNLLVLKSDFIPTNSVPNRWKSKIGNEISLVLCSDKKSTRDVLIESCPFSLEKQSRTVYIKRYRQYITVRLYEAKSGKNIAEKVFALDPESCLEKRFFSNEVIERGSQDLKRGLDEELVDDNDKVVDKSFVDRLEIWLSSYIDR